MPPAPGMMPSRVSGRATRALDAKTRNVVVRASSSPPPNAREETALMVGMGSLASVSNVPRSKVRKSRVWAVEKVRRSFRSAPAQKAVSIAEERIRARVGSALVGRRSLVVSGEEVDVESGAGPGTWVWAWAWAWAWISETMDAREARREVEMALRDRSLLSLRMRI